ncbi:hypothetical protein DTO006G1_8833 [Penicillium roqueforti]|uniref:uncharacterized protein n=1 Tax=Penicillium roqueforti TaxID=5082 RepID=UPI00190DC0F0|nr:uncharacterized protein LCP9604111_1266 [Penicillium roqueforti]KAF9253740.1 hypothetical protein LCP9604111_1266 [Penicillium roqueforti]KAI1835373.1 hypothetical protein CBS147337_3396 [Penicillium roqueforti]KAI2686246.1 hypothetical protein CBS147355_1733 [Penicillium roqueforti]KAI2687388.1 hypothetical protein LCP963914a_3989 [Penicillium roqueforti]KAI2706249.1 hypothetical protein CBS147372_160 [Penicillium roqueforti]
MNWLRGREVVDHNDGSTPLPILLTALDPGVPRPSSAELECGPVRFIISIPRPATPPPVVVMAPLVTAVALVNPATNEIKALLEAKKDSRNKTQVSWQISAEIAAFIKTSRDPPKSPVFVLSQRGIQ